MTLDFIQDACDSLDRSEASYLVIVFIPDSSATRVFSNVGGNLDAIREMMDDGGMDQVLKNHLDSLES